MDALVSEAVEVDLHRLELRYAKARLACRRAVESLARSIDQCGQLVPCLVVAEDERLVLIDGYRRVAALRRLGRDTARVERWAADLSQALVSVLVRAQGRAFAVIEEALLVRELVCGLHLSQHELARASGRDVSWVNRRLQLVTGLPDVLLAAVQAGEISSWAATRILAPLARANSEHAERLLRGLCEAALSTRALRLWFAHYQSADRATRERLVEHPRLFMQALQQRDASRELERLRAGPEGDCLADLQRLQRLLARLRKRLPRLLSEAFVELVASEVERLQAALAALQKDLEHHAENCRQPDLRCGAHAASAEQEPARNQPAAAALP